MVFVVASTSAPGPRAVARALHRRSARARTKRTVTRATRLIPRSGDLNAFVTAVAQQRGRCIRLLPFDLGPDAPSGLWLKEPAVDWIVYDSKSGAQQREAIVCHEIAHMLLGHDRAVDGVELSVVAPYLSPEVTARFLAPAPPTWKADAEIVATTLATELARRAYEHGSGEDSGSASRP